MSFEAGATVDAYRIISTLGSGGMGKVFRVEHALTNRQEAMKVLAGARLRAGDEAQRFLREIRLQASLNHPNIAAVHHAFWLNDDLVMVMELVEGATLRSLLEVGRIPLKTALNFAGQALGALHYAHQHSVVHRDVTPANILITPGGVVKLTDFGLAKAPSDLRLTQTGALMGSLYYMSPEQVRGISTLDGRTDVYSLGVVLYEMTTGSRPFEAEDPFSLMRAHVQQAPTPPCEVNPSLPPELNEILLAALAKEPERRFSSAEAFRVTVEKLQGSLVILGTSESRWTGRWRGLRILRYGAVTALLCMALMIGLAKRNAGTGVSTRNASIESDAARPAASQDARPSVTARKPVAHPKTEPPKNQKNSENNPPHRRFWLWRALGKVAHPRGQQASEVKP
jgi:serine/threonine-protein kinase